LFRSLHKVWVRALLALALSLVLGVVGYGQKPKAVTEPKPAPAQNDNELSKLHDNYIKATREYKASLEKLLALYQASARKAEERVAQSKKLFADGLISQREVELNERTLADANLKVTEVQTQISGADTQIAQALVEIEGDKQIAKLGRLPKGGMIKTTSFIRYSGTGSWLLSQAGKVEAFFQQTFKRPLPIAVFGQGSIHNQWHLDHRNAMDISLNPDGPEGQALMEFLRSNGIPFSAFRGAIPGVATGPHIHIGLPSHRY
jgi:hypothetical protein